MIISALYEQEANKYHLSRGKIRHDQTHELVIRDREEVDGNWVRRQQIVKDFRPYCYVVWNKSLQLEDRKRTVMRPLTPAMAEDDFRVERVIVDSGERNADGDKLGKIIFKSPEDLRMWRYNHSHTFEADVPYEDRYLVDNVDEIKPYKMRKLFLDLEALQYTKDDGPILCKNPHNPRDNQMINVIGVYDSFTATRMQWCQHESFEEGVDIKQFDGDTVVVRRFTTEKAMLTDFVGYIDEVDPDCILAWGMGFYDLPTLYYRLESLGIGSDKLSPSSLGVKRFMRAPTKGVQYRWTAQPVIGRLMISLDRLFERIYKDSKSSTLPSMKLDIVGQRLFGRGKTEFRPDFYDAGYDEFIEDYLYYNYRDVELMVEIEESYNLVEGQQNLQELAKCQFNSTFYGSSYARVYFMRKANFKQKSGYWQGYMEEDNELQGAIVLDPEELGTIGLHKNVAILDFAGLYPSMMLTFNTCWTTKVKPGEEDPDDIIGDGCRFKRSPMGILPRCVKELDELRDRYKALRNAASDDADEYRKWDDSQKTVKRLRATFYGLMALKGYAWGDIHIARTITHGGRTMLKKIMKESERLGYKVIYGHTDSIFVKLGDDKTPEECAQAGIELGKHLTKMCQEEYRTDAIDVEAELIMDKFYLPRRNRYAGRIMWKPDYGDSPFDIAKEPVDKRIKMQGLEAKHTNTAQVGRTAQLESIKMIWDDATPEQVMEYVTDLIESVREGDVPTEDLLARARLGKWLTNFSENLVPKDDNGKRTDAHHPLCNNKRSYSYVGADGKDKKCECSRWYGAPDHYLPGATNEDAKPNSSAQELGCYSFLDGVARGAAWHNVILSDDVYPELDKGDSFYYTFVKDGPTWIPNGGYIAFHDISQIEGYELDINRIIEKNIIDKLDHILYGIGLDNNTLRKEEAVKYSIEDFQ